MAITFKDLYEGYLQFKSTKIKASTISVYRTHLLNHILPAIGDIDLTFGFSNKQMNTFISYLLDEKGLSKSSARDIKITVTNLLRYGETYHGLPAVPIYIVDWPSANLDDRNVIQFFTKEECNKVFEAMDERPSNILLGITIGITTGLRIGEICGLRFSDVDFDGHTLHVRRTLQRVYLPDYEVYKNNLELVQPQVPLKKETKATFLVANKPKTITSNRVIPLSRIAYKWIKRYAAKSPSDCYILTQATGVCEPRTFRSQYYKEIERLGLPRLNPHCMRHTFATQMLHGKIDVATIADIMGHSSPSVTLNIYSHTNDREKKKAINKIFGK